MRKRLIWLNILIIFVFVFTSGAAAHPVSATSPIDQEPQLPDYRPGVVLVGFYPEVFGQNELSLSGTTPSPVQSDIVSLQQQLGEGSLRPLFSAPLPSETSPRLAFLDGKYLEGSTAVFELVLTSGASVESAIQTLRENPAVAFAEPDYQAVAAATLPNDPRLSEQWGLAKIQAPAAWDTTKGSSDTIIAVIDSGILLNHPDLASQLWTNPYELAGNDIDDDLNGYIDDVHGANVLTKTGVLTDATGHGTQVAGVIAAASDNGLGIAGVCWNCKLMIVKVMGDGVTANYSDIAAGINYAVKMGAKVINLSLGGYSDSLTLKTAVQAAAQTAVVVAGAGNDNKSNRFYPAAYTGSVVAVAGTDQNDSKHSASNYGDWISVSAPGENILTTDSGGTYYVPGSGTSLATPFVSGLAGLLVSQNPGWSPLLVRQQMAHTANAIDAANPTLTGKMGSGRINAQQAVTIPPKPNLAVLDFTVNARLGGSIKADGNPVPLTLTLGNDWLSIPTATATLSSSSPVVTISKNTTTFTSAADGLTLTNSTDALQVSVAAGQYGLNLPFRLTITAGGVTQLLDFNVQSESQQVIVTSPITSSATWLNTRTYHITGNLIVKDSAVLTIEPGTQVLVDPGFFIKFQSGAALIADGTAEAPIVFTTSSAAHSRWSGITFISGAMPAVLDANGDYLSGSIVRHVEISYAENGLAMQTSAPYIASSRFDFNTNGINQGADSSPTIVDCAFNNNGIGIALFSGQALIKGNTFRSNVTAIGQIYGTNSTTPLSPNILNNLILNNQTAVYFMQMPAGSESVIVGNTIMNHAISLYTITLSQSMILTNNRLINNEGMIVGSLSSANIQHNLVVSNGKFSQCQMPDCSRPAFWLNVSSSGSPLNISNNTIINNYGIALMLVGSGLSTLTVTQNNLFGNKQYDISAGIGTQGQTVDAKNNYWGAISTGEIGGRVNDCNDDAMTSCGDLTATMGEVLYDPALTAPAQSAPAYVTGMSFDPQPVGINQTGTATIRFSREMDTSILPTTTFFNNNRGTTESIAGTEGSAFLARDPGGNIWVGCETMIIESPCWGIKTFDGQRWKTYDTSNGLGSNNLGALFITASGDVWAAHTDGTTLLSRLSGGTWRTFSYSDLPQGVTYGGSIIRSIGEDLSGNVWFGAIGRIYRFDGTNWKLYTSADNPLITTNASISSVAHDGQGRMWFAHTGAASGNQNGLSMFDGAAWHTFSQGSGLPSTIYNIQGVFGDSHGRVWFGLHGFDAGSTAITLGMIDNLTFRYYRMGDDGYPGYISTPTGFAEDNDGNVWIAVSGSYPAAATMAVYDGQKFSTRNVPLASPFLFDRRNNMWMGVNSLIPADKAKVKVLWGGDDYTFDPGVWQDAKTYQASYFFNELIPQGTYQVAVEGAYGLDTMEAHSGKFDTFTVDYAGQVTESAPPNTPNVSAGGVEGVPGVMKASWQLHDPNNQVDSYRYAIGSSRGTTDILYWTTTTQAQVERSGLPLVTGSTYWVSVQAHNGAGLWSSIGLASFLAGQRPKMMIYLPAIRR